MIGAPSCPICNRRVDSAATSPHFPFCSERCKLVDLNRWATGKYAIVESLLPREDERAAPGPGVDDETD